MITSDDYDRPADGAHIRTYTGMYVDPTNFTVTDVHYVDIGYALSKICRYGGHLRSHFSVAEHCLNVAAQLSRMYHDHRLVLAGLLHDASEAYLGDVVRPFKHSDEMKRYRDLEDEVLGVIYYAFGIGDLLGDERIHEVDQAILPWEMAMIRDSMVRVAPDMDDVAAAYVRSVVAQYRMVQAGHVDGTEQPIEVAVPDEEE